MFHMIDFQHFDFINTAVTKCRTVQKVNTISHTISDQTLVRVE